jgi:uncharacterized damage-inducible protein DinB
MTPPSESSAGTRMAMQSPRLQFLDSFDREHATTMRILRAYPTDKLELKPHSKCKTARDLAWMFAMEQAFAEKALTTGLDWTKPNTPPPAPATMDAILDAIEQGHRRVVSLVEGMRDEEMLGTVKFFTAPKTIGDVQKMAFLWMLLFDQVHHRGQFSVYLRMADGKVPSIYGPTADEPWM